MYSRRLELSVGAFVLLGALCLAFLALEVSGLTQTGDSGSYRLSARFDNVAGLTTRAKVSAAGVTVCLLYTSPSPRDATLSRMPSSA